MFNQNEAEAIKATMRSAGWPLIEAMLLEEADNVCRIKTDGKRFEDIAIEAMAVEKVHEAVSRTMKRLASFSNKATVEKRSYK